MTILSTAEAADRLGLCRQRIVALIQSGKLKAVRVGRFWAIDARDLAAFRRRKVDKGGRPRQQE